MKRFVGYCFLFLYFCPPAYAQIQFERHTITNNFSGAYWVFAIDMDHDRDIDLVTASTASGIAWWRNSGGSFSKASVGSFDGAWAAHAADVDRDGDIDVMGASSSLHQFALWKRTGGFSKITLGPGNSAESVHAADLDDDGDLDVIGAAWGDGIVYWWQNNNGNFTQKVLDNLRNAHSVWAADLDRDGKVDGIATGPAESYWYRNNGNGSFTRRNLFSNGGLCVFAADVDGVKGPDVLLTERSGDVVLLKNNGGGGFSASTIESGYGGSWSVVAGDVNGDGKLDVAAAGFDANNVKVWLNNGGGSFGKGIIVDNVNTVRGVYIADLDNDGDGDIAAAIRGDKDLAWYETKGTSGGDPPPDDPPADDPPADDPPADDPPADDPPPDDPPADDPPADEPPADETPKTITVIRPNGGEVVNPGEDYTIRWESQGTINAVAIEYSTDNGNTWSTYRSATDNDGRLSWRDVPDVATGSALVRVTDAADVSVSDVSDNVFAIAGSSPSEEDPPSDDPPEEDPPQDEEPPADETPKTITIIRPNGGEVIDPGADYTIRWESAGEINALNIEVSTDNGNTWAIYRSNTENDGRQKWAEIPDVATANALIRIADASDDSINDVSDKVFSIAGSAPPDDPPADDPPVDEPPVDDPPQDEEPPADETAKTITVIAPNGGEVINPDEEYSLRWQSQGDITVVKVEFSTNNGGSWSTYRTDTDNDGGLRWSEIPDVATQSALVRISDAFDASIGDVSDNTFVIAGSSPPEDNPPVEPPANDSTGTETERAITVISPNGGETLSPSEDYRMVWSTQGEIIAVNIEYSTDNGRSWLVFRTDTRNDGHQMWREIPDVAAANALIRISDASDSSISDISDDSFVIAGSSPPEDNPPADPPADDSTGTEERVITVMHPNGGETIEPGEDYKIMWHTEGEISGVNIEYSIDNGSTWSTYLSNTSNDGRERWGDIPDVATASALIRISDASNDSISDVSDQAFVIEGRMLFADISNRDNGESEASDLLRTREASTQPDVVSMPVEVELLPSYPNPFNMETTFRYNLPEASVVTLTIYNIRGQVVRKLVDELQSPGFKKISWNGRTNTGEEVSTGIYLARLQVGNEVRAIKLTIQK